VPFALALLLASGASCFAYTEALQDHGYEWATISASGNRAATVEEAGRNAGFGAVNYEYRMSKTEVTVGQWFEFVQAYAPYYVGSARDERFTGLNIRAKTDNPAKASDWELHPGSTDLPQMMSWRWAAIYANWINSGKRSDRSAFEYGAYDTSTFSDNPDGTFNDQTTRSAGAQYWIPNRNEWIKAMYFDPRRNGYWGFPTASDIVPRSGVPGIGETNSGLLDYPYLQMPTAQYPATMSPWGLLDGSGGVAEYVEDAFGEQGKPPMYRAVYGTEQQGFGPQFDSLRLAGRLAAEDDYFFFGLRLASSVPAPMTSVVLLGPLAFFFRAARRRNGP